MVQTSLGVQSTNLGKGVSLPVEVDNEVKFRFAKRASAFGYLSLLTIISVKTGLFEKYRETPVLSI